MGGLHQNVLLHNNVKQQLIVRNPHITNLEPSAPCLIIYDGFTLFAVVKPIIDNADTIIRSAQNFHGSGGPARFDGEE